MIKNVLPSLRQGAACKGSAANKKASAAALPVTPSRKPRTCGEKFNPFSPPLSEWGSPPHVRGKDKLAIFEGIVNGITPAYAGKRQHQGPCPQAGRDHPRVCGEKKFGFVLHPPAPGSPPRMRGKGGHPCGGPWALGITPAYAGKSRCRSRPGNTGWDHPRVCGEKRPTSSPETMSIGSPPHVRGKATTHRPQPHRQGDHPRMCGEKLFIGYFKGSNMGSPPHVRGKVPRNRRTGA